METGVHREHVHDSGVRWRPCRDSLHLRPPQEDIPLLHGDTYSCSKHCAGCWVGFSR